MLKQFSKSAFTLSYPRYSGTDYVNGKIVEGIANSIQECQVRSNLIWNHFLIFTIVGNKIQSTPFFTELMY